MLRIGLKVVRVGEPVRVRGVLRRCTLRVLVDKRAKTDPELRSLEAKKVMLFAEMKELREEAAENWNG